MYDFVQMLDCPMGVDGSCVFLFSLRMLISLMESEQTADAQNRTSFFLCAVVGCAVFPLETHFQQSCGCVKINQSIYTVNVKEI